MCDLRHPLHCRRGCPCKNLRRQPESCPRNPQCAGCNAKSTSRVSTTPPNGSFLPRKQVGKVTRWHVKPRKQDWHLGAPDMAIRGLDGLVLNCAAHREDCGEAEARPDALARDVGAIAQSQRAGLLHGPRRGASAFSHEMETDKRSRASR